jgi:DNA-binding GntR family transcriptional regulator
MIRQSDEFRQKSKQGGSAMPITKTDRVREALADDILTGRITAGTRLDEVRLADRFKLSRTPVREALKQLSASGLIRFVSHRGAQVTTLSERQASELFTAVAEVEASCAGLCAVNMTADERYRLETLHESCGNIVREGDAEAYHGANIDFHHAIHEGCHNEILVELATSLRLRLAPLSRVQFRGGGRLARSFAEHEVIVQAILRGDREQALQAMRDHLAVVERAFIGVASGMGSDSGRAAE